MHKHDPAAMSAVYHGPGGPRRLQAATDGADYPSGEVSYSAPAEPDAYPGLGILHHVPGIIVPPGEQPDAHWYQAQEVRGDRVVWSGPRHGGSRSAAAADLADRKLELAPLGFEPERAVPGITLAAARQLAAAAVRAYTIELEDQGRTLEATPAGMGILLGVALSALEAEDPNVWKVTIRHDPESRGITVRVQPRVTGWVRRG